MREATDWTDDDRDAVYASLASGELDEARARVANFEKLPPNAFSPKNKKAFAALSAALRDSPKLEEKLVRMVESDQIAESKLALYCLQHVDRFSDDLLVEPIRKLFQRMMSGEIEARETWPRLKLIIKRAWRFPSAELYNMCAEMYQSPLDEDVINQWIACWDDVRRKSIGLDLPDPGPVEQFKEDIKDDVFRQNQVSIGHGAFGHSENQGQLHDFAWKAIKSGRTYRQALDLVADLEFKGLRYEPSEFSFLVINRLLFDLILGKKESFRWCELEIFDVGLFEASPKVQLLWARTLGRGFELSEILRKFHDGISWFYRYQLDRRDPKPRDGHLIRWFRVVEKLEDLLGEPIGGDEKLNYDAGMIDFLHAYTWRGDPAKHQEEFVRLIEKHLLTSSYNDAVPIVTLREKADRARSRGDDRAKES